MQAIILAAGMGRRLGALTSENTKCMVKVNGVRLIDRLLGQLATLQLKRVIIVVGYQGQKLIDHVKEWNKENGGLKIEFFENPIYDKTNNIYSLSIVKDQLQKDDTLLIESDLIFSDRLFPMILENPCPNLALVAKYESWMDGTMVRLDEDLHIVNFISKDAFDYADVDSYYKTVNIYKFSREFLQHQYVPFLDAYTKAVGNNEYYENVLRIISMLNSHHIKALPIGQEKWYEIDDKQDLDIAEALFATDARLLLSGKPLLPIKAHERRAPQQLRYLADGIPLGHEGKYAYRQQVLRGKRAFHCTRERCCRIDKSAYGGHKGSWNFCALDWFRSSNL